MAIGPVEADGKKQRNLDCGVEKTQNQIIPQGYVNDALLQGKANPERYGDHQIDDQRVAQDIDSVQKLLVFLDHNNSGIRSFSDCFCRLFLSLPYLCLFHNCCISVLSRRGQKSCCKKGAVL